MHGAYPASRCPNIVEVPSLAVARGPGAGRRTNGVLLAEGASSSDSFAKNACSELVCFRRAGPGTPFCDGYRKDPMLDQQTKQHLAENFQQIKPQIQQAFPDVPEQELTKAQSNPEQLVTTIEQKTGHSKDQIEQQLKQLVSRV